MMVLEIATFSVEAAIQAIQAGAHRIELCENPQEGGTTPSYGALVLSAKIKNAPIFPIIRPRGGDFLYSPTEFEIMKNDVVMAKELGFPGIVIGLLLADGNIDVQRTSELVTLAGNMHVTFHRAFDRCLDPIKGLEDVIQTGCKRILTSGQVPNVQNALPLVQQLVQLAKERIIIMPGSGVRANNINNIIRTTGAKEIHSSARKMFDSNMQFQKNSMQEHMQYTGVDVGEIKEMLSQLI
ncbi:MAG: copper homeostasis protein CutC [Chitinophagia bacterium]|jgi:copper homeostasis protein|nr:copper homeostasis protein CutC [Chitinophagia bacterium]